MSIEPLNIFYEEPDPDRWFRFDRYPRKLIRRILRGKQKPGGVMLVAINLMEGLKKIGIPFRFNDYNYIKKHPKEIACIIGKPQLLTSREWKNPIIFGAGIFPHPVEDPDLLISHPNIKMVLVPGDWMREMFTSYYGDIVKTWPTGIDTDRWHPVENNNKQFDFLVYDKVRWEHDKYEQGLIMPIIDTLKQLNLSYQFIKYGSYMPDELTAKLSNSRSAIFLCEHETQGLAYQQILATDTPILAWDRGGYWQDPYYYPNKAKFEPVSSVPYWDERCGVKFEGAEYFERQLRQFLNKLDTFEPRQYILENLTLEKCAERYVELHGEVQRQLL